MRKPELVRLLDRVLAFRDPDPALEQVATPPEAAAELLLEAVARGDLDGKPVADLGSGTGRLSIGASALGAHPVIGIEMSETAVLQARATATSLGRTVDFRVGPVEVLRAHPGTVVMNPPFGAQRRRADRPFWEVAFSAPDRPIYTFALAESRTFIEREVVARRARIEATRPIPWELPRTFAHHRRRSVSLEVDLWVLRTARTEP